MNKTNLLLLADRLEKLPKNYAHFHMMTYVDRPDLDDDELRPKEITRKFLNECGTVACAVGHGPSIKGLEAHKDEYWSDYSKRVFGVDGFDDEFEFMFGSDWSEWDNTPQGAARRIRHCVEHGVPEDWAEFRP